MRELAPDIYSLGHGKGGHVHAFLIDNRGELTLVDTLFEGDARLVLEAIRSLGRSASDLKRIAITHGHAAAMPIAETKKYAPCIRARSLSPAKPPR